MIDRVDPGVDHGPGLDQRRSQLDLAVFSSSSVAPEGEGLGNLHQEAVRIGPGLGAKSSVALDGVRLAHEIEGGLADEAR